MLQVNITKIPNLDGVMTSSRFSFMLTKYISDIEIIKGIINAKVIDEFDLKIDNSKTDNCFYLEGDDIVFDFTLPTHLIGYITVENLISIKKDAEDHLRKQLEYFRRVERGLEELKQFALPS